MLCILQNRLGRSGIRCISDLETFSGRSKYHIRSQESTILLHGLTTQQNSPVFPWDLCCLCPADIKLACTVNLHRISITQYVVIYTKRLQAVTIHLERLFRTFDLLIYNLKWQFRRKDAQRAYNPLSTFRSNQGKWFLPICIAHSKQ